MLILYITMKTFFSTDWHGEYHKARKALFLAGFDYNKDRLVFGGDYSDRGSKSFECMELLLSIKNLVYIRGNHCECILDMFTKNRVDLWKYGQKQTLISYINNSDKYRDSKYSEFVREKMSGVIPEVPTNLAPITHINLLTNSLHYFIDEDNRFYVHAGYLTNLKETPLEEQTGIMTWDRQYVNNIINLNSFDPNFKEVFLGHTPVQHLDETDRVKNVNNLWLCDTGSGKFSNAPVTVINVKTKESFYGY